jgi:hypothetical protein
MELSELRRHWGGKTYEFHNRHGAYGQRKEAKALAALDAEELRRDGFLARVTMESQDYGIWAVVWKGPQVGPVMKVEVIPDPANHTTHRVAKIAKDGYILAARYAEPFPTRSDALRDFRQNPGNFRPYDEGTNTFVPKQAKVHSRNKKSRPRLSR